MVIDYPRIEMVGKDPVERGRVRRALDVPRVPCDQEFVRIDGRNFVVMHVFTVVPDEPVAEVTWEVRAE